MFHADAIDEAVLEHYVTEFHAWEMPLLGHLLHFVIEETASKNFMEVYMYEWTDDEV